MAFRTLYASDRSPLRSFEEKWGSLTGEEDSLLDRDQLLAELRKRENGTDVSETRLEMATALSFFELMLMTAAPTMYQSDMWVKWLTAAQPVWIPSRDHRFLTSNILVAILRTSTGAGLLQLWRELKWESSILATLVKLTED